MVLYPSKYGVYRRSHILGNNLSRYFSSFFKKRNSWFFIINDKLFMSIFLNKEHVTESSHQLMVFTLRCKYIWNRRSDGLKRIGVRIEAGRKMHSTAKARVTSTSLSTNLLLWAESMSSHSKALFVFMTNSLTTLPNSSHINLTFYKPLASPAMLCYAIVTVTSSIPG